MAGIGATEELPGCSTNMVPSGISNINNENEPSSLRLPREMIDRRTITDEHNA